jgi:hypothetical protein
MKRIMIIGCLSLILIASCKKDHNPIDEPVTDSVLDYMPLAIGNYWIYETFSCDSGEINCVSVSVDTTKVTKDTVIGANHYFKLEGNFELFTDPLFIRDSGNYLVNYNGQVLFTSTDSVNIFNEQAVPGLNADTMFYWYTRLVEPDNQVPVGSGTYDCLDFRTSLFRQQDNFQTEHQTHHYFAKDIGPVKQTSLFVSSLKVFKRELIAVKIGKK